MRTKLGKSIFTATEILNAYCESFFPMADEKSKKILWYSPEERAIFPLFHIKPPKSLQKILKLTEMKCTINQNFEAVIKFCSNRNSTWISDEIIEIYCHLHRIGFAHSVETWLGEKIVGGLYGVSINSAFFGESMFYTVSNASKIAFYFLIEHLQKQNFSLLDSQFINPFTKQLGAITVARDKYLKILNYSINRTNNFLK